MIESYLHREPDGSYTVRRGSTAALELEPKLAEQLERLGKLSRTNGPDPAPSNWDQQPAILVVRVAGRGERGGNDRPCRIVAFKFFTMFEFSVVPCGYKKKLKIVYRMLTVTPAGDVAGEGQPEEWSAPARLGHVSNQLRQNYNKTASLESLARWHQFHSRVNSLLSLGARHALESHAADEENRRRMMARPGPP